MQAAQEHAKYEAMSEKQASKEIKRLEKLMLDIMYDVPSSEDIIQINITHPVVTGESKPLVRRKHGRAAA